MSTAALPYDRTAVYTALLGPTWYGKGDHWRPVWRLILDRLRQRTDSALLDVGTGRGELVQATRAAGYTAEGCDIAPCQSWITRATLPDLPYPPRSFDVVCCFDVLEHLPPEDVPAALRALMVASSDTVVLSVATIPHVVTVEGHGQVDLHLTQWTFERWAATIDAVADRSACRIPVHGQPAWRHYIGMRRQP